LELDQAKDLVLLVVQVLIMLKQPAVMQQSLQVITKFTYSQETEHFA
jgi:hypothetical protein